MFGKKLLSIICVLFVGQFSRVSATYTKSLPVCGTTQSSCDGTTYSAGATYFCVDDNKIYGMDGTDACQGKLEDGVHLFVYTSETGITEATIGENASDVNKLIAYNCSNGVCQQTSGYFKNASNTYYNVNTSSGDATVTTKTGATDCTGKIGELISNGGGIYLCLDSDKSILTYKSDGDPANGNFLVTSFSVDGTPKTNAVVKANNSYVIYDELYNGEEDCVNEDKEIQKRDVNWCASDTCNYYDCAAGTCTDITARNPTCNPTVPSNCGEGYYLYHADGRLVSANGETGTLYLCNTGGAACKIVAEVNDSQHTNTPIPKGYLINADTENFATVPFFKCTEGACTAIALTTSSTDCTGKAIGDLIYTTSESINTYSVCTATSGDPIITLATYNSGTKTITNKVNNKKYLISVKYDNRNVFGEAASGESDFIYASTEITDGSITTIENEGRYVYTTSTSAEIKERGNNDICAAVPPSTIKSPKSGMTEYKQDEGTKLYDQINVKA